MINKLLSKSQKLARHVPLWARPFVGILFIVICGITSPIWMFIFLGEEVFEAISGYEE